MYKPSYYLYTTTHEQANGKESDTNDYNPHDFILYKIKKHKDL